MEEIHTDYFLRRILPTDASRPFVTSTIVFNTPSNTLEEFVLEDIDCHGDGKCITYIFGKEDTIIGVARMKPMSFEEFRNEINEKNIFEYEEIEAYSDIQILYMSRVGVSSAFEDLGFGTMLRSFLDGHARSNFNHFLLYALINEKMLQSLIKIKGKREFFETYKISRELYDEKWKYYWVILREFNRL